MPHREDYISDDKVWGPRCVVRNGENAKPTSFIEGNYVEAGEKAQLVFSRKQHVCSAQRSGATANRLHAHVEHFWHEPRDELREIFGNFAILSVRLNTHTVMASHKAEKNSFQLHWVESTDLHLFPALRRCNTMFSSWRNKPQASLTFYMSRKSELIWWNFLHGPLFRFLFASPAPLGPLFNVAASHTSRRRIPVPTDMSADTGRWNIPKCWRFGLSIPPASLGRMSCSRAMVASGVY